jgi:transcription antitermination factor NusG
MGEAAACLQDAVCWYAAYTWVHHEKQVAKQLAERQVDCFLPLYRSVRRWKDRSKELELALFPGYVFVRMAWRSRLQVLQLPRVVRLISSGGQPAPLPESEMEALRQGLAHQIYGEPHPYLKVGRRVRIAHGPMAGTEGILVRKKDRLRVVLSIDLLMRSVAIEVDAADLESVR